MPGGPARLNSASERKFCLESNSADSGETPPGTGYRHPVNFMLTAAELEELNKKQPAACQELAETWRMGKIDFCGEELDRPAMLQPLESVLWNFRTGHAIYERILKQRLQMWARRRFGFSTLLPMLLNRMGYQSAFHFAAG
ncbi:MAG: hypothetical protein R3C11_25500 [Planctomycetaceae bacterium]